MMTKSLMATLAGVCVLLALSGAAQAVLLGRYSFEAGPDASWYFENTASSPGTMDALSKYVNGANSVVTGQGPVLTTNSATDHYVTLDGNDFIIAPDAFLDGASAWTLSVWFNATTNGMKMLGSTDAAHGNDGFALELATDSGKVGRVRYAQRTGASWSSAIFSDSAMNDGQWHHVIITYNGTNYWMYVDGVKQAGSAADTAGTTNTLTDGKVLIGSYGVNATADKWIGGLDEIRIYNNAFTDADALALYNATRIIPEPTTMALLGVGAIGLMLRRRR
ncbi:MAG TPA: hypothetical protein DCX07_03555 [Phycisphaerales bacterium]|nr:hypothetical protein [Phycisphaerales bacterium]